MLQIINNVRNGLYVTYYIVLECDDMVLGKSCKLSRDSVTEDREEKK